MFFDFPFGSNTLILAIWLVCLDFSGLVSLPCKKENKWAKLASVSSTANASLVFLAPKHLMVPPASGKSRVISWSYCGVVFLLLAEGLLVSLASAKKVFFLSNKIAFHIPLLDQSFKSCYVLQVVVLAPIKGLTLDKFAKGVVGRKQEEPLFAHLLCNHVVRDCPFLTFQQHVVLLLQCYIHGHGSSLPKVHTLQNGCHGSKI